MKQNTINIDKSERLPVLDSVRGIAALVVVLGHCAMIWPEPLRKQLPFWIKLSPARILLASYPCVILFFVLSGYVLTIPFLRQNRPHYSTYLIKRLCRIYLPFAAAIFCSALLYYFSQPAPEGLGSTWFESVWATQNLSLSTMRDHFAMTGLDKDMWLDSVMWSLVYELRISLLFPVFVLLGEKPRQAVPCAVLLYIIASVGAVETGNAKTLSSATDFVGSILLTMRFATFFIIGSTLAIHNISINAWLKKLPNWLLSVLFIGALLTLVMPSETQNQWVRSNMPLLVDNGFSKYGVEFCFGIASAFIIVVARNSETVRNMLLVKPLKWLGKVSYSLYLIHLPIMFFLFRWFLGKFSFGFVALLAVAITLVVAELFNRFVEIPSMQLGRAFTKIRRENQLLIITKKNTVKSLSKK